MKELLPAALAFAGGVLIEFINYVITGFALKKGTGAAFILPLRILIAAGFIAALYFIGAACGLDTTVFMAAGALGATAGLILFTLLLRKKQKGGVS